VFFFLAHAHSDYWFAWEWEQGKEWQTPCRLHQPEALHGMKNVRPDHAAALPALLFVLQREAQGIRGGGRLGRDLFPHPVLTLSSLILT